ncbi:MAG TPA: hypothetical protein VLH39_01020 [Magnetospirillaceae bacterium]|nr:hypothetical protein [Magnetospirillaceae bacterium]
MSLPKVRSPHLLGKPLSAIPVILAALASLASCAASLSLELKTDGSGTFAVDARVPGAVAARLRSFAAAASSPASGPLFDPSAVRRRSAELGLAAVAAETPSPDRFRGSFSMASLAAVASGPELAQAGVLVYSQSDGAKTLTFSLSRANAWVLPDLFPGLDPYVLEALSPPALDQYPLTAPEYREMLAALLGQTALRDLEAAEIRIQIRTPSPIVRHSGGDATGRTFTAVLSFMDILVLERPVEFSVAWR